MFCGILITKITLKPETIFLYYLLKLSTLSDSKFEVRIILVHYEPDYERIRKY